MKAAKQTRELTDTFMSLKGGKGEMRRLRRSIKDSERGSMASTSFSRRMAG